MRLSSISLLVCVVLALPLVVDAGEEAASLDREAALARLAALDATDAVAAYKLALEIEAAGLENLAGQAYQRVLAADPGHRAARRALGYEQVAGRWHQGDDLWRAKGFIHHGDRWMTAQEFAEATRPQREAAEQKAGEARVLRLVALVASEDEESVQEGRRLLALEEDRFKLAPLAKALRCEPVSLRHYAAAELGRMGDPLAVPALLKRAIEDPDEDVRAAVGDALREIGEPSTIDPLARAMGSRYADVRVRAAEAIGRLGDEVGAGVVIRRWSARSGDFPRVYFAQVRQISYIQDFDVEVAQTSFIADPIIGVLQEGVVQTMKILATEQTFEAVEQVGYVNALRRLTGEDFGRDLRAWQRWWGQNEQRLMGERAVRLERARED